MNSRREIPRRAVEAHEAAVAKGLDFYVDPDTGFMVMTALYLRERGHCCDNDCRHCPWGDD